MKKVGIFYGSDTGSTEEIAKVLGKKLNASSDVFDVSKADAAQLGNYDVLFLGSSTQGYGDLQDDWDSFIDKLKTADLSGKKVAVFGLGDSSSYSDTFCDAIGVIAKAAKEAGATLIGDKVNSADYTFDDSAALVDGSFCGLPLDEDNESEQTEDRLNAWLSGIKGDLE